MVENVHPNDLNKLVVSDPFESALEHETFESNKPWMEYVKKALNGKFQEAGFISPHQTSAIGAVKWHLLAPLQIVVTRKNNCRYAGRKHLTHHAVQIMAYEPNDLTPLSVRCLCPKSQGKMFHIYHNDIVWRRRELKGMYAQLLTEIQTKHLWIPRNLIYPIEDWDKLRKHFDQSAYQMIHPGMVLEMQLEENPRLVVIAEIVQNHRGLLKIKFGDDYLRYIHMTSPFVHQCGWARRHRGEVILVPGMYENGPGNLEIPPCVVWKNGVPLNKLRQNEIVVILDHNRRNFYFAHVELIPRNKTFFHLVVGNKRVLNPRNNRPMFFHLTHDHIFSYKLLRKIGVEVKLPLKFTMPQTDTKVYGDRVMIYQKYFLSHPAMIAPECIGAHSEYQLFWEDMDYQRRETMLRDIGSLKYVEICLPVLDGTMQMHAARVVAVNFFLLTLKVAGKEGLMYAHPHDRSVYHFGTSKDWTAMSDFGEPDFDLDM